MFDELNNLNKEDLNKFAYFVSAIWLGDTGIPALYGSQPLFKKAMHFADKNEDYRTEFYNYVDKKSFGGISEQAKRNAAAFLQRISA